jgi:Beta-lactamase
MIMLRNTCLKWEKFKFLLGLKVHRMHFRFFSHWFFFVLGDTPILEAPKNKITIHQLLTHTAGFTYDFFNPLTLKYSQINKVPSFLAFKRSTILTPLSFEPGK